MACNADLDLASELNSISIEDEVDTCSITAVNGDSDNEHMNIEPPCIYHPTLEDVLKYKVESEKQFQKMRDSLTFAFFKQKIKDEGPWQGWESIKKGMAEHAGDISSIMFTAQSMTSGYDKVLDDFICFMYVMSQTQHEDDFLKFYCDEFSLNK